MTSLAAGLSLAIASPAGAQNRVDLQGLGYDLGDPAAPVAVVEFGDFGCSACAIFARETWPEIRARFIDTGRIRWKYVPFALGGYPNSDRATRAAACAADEDRFWAMHDHLYADQRGWMRTRRPSPVFASIAAAIGLDAIAFERCLTRGDGRDRTPEANRAARALRVRATPTFFIDGARTEGALPFEMFRELLERAEKAAGAGAGATAAPRTAPGTQVAPEAPWTRG